jgi:AcrR family transcriptional regulator
MGDRREEILGAAMAVADERGLGALSMRAVAERVGVTPMALYPHVGDKSALLDGMIGKLLGELSAPLDRDAPWDDRLRRSAYAFRALGRDHPWAASLLFSRSAVSAEAVGTIDEIYLALLDAGVPDSEVPRFERMLGTFIVGYAASEAGGRFGAGARNPRGRRDEESGKPLPGHTRVAEWLDVEVDWDAEFDADLDDLRRMIEAAVAARSTRAEHG